MITALDIVAGLLLAGTFATALTVLGAWQLGRAVSRDEEQREIEGTRAQLVRADPTIRSPV
jgi:cytochrome oxidase assembly protein ShyY1